MNIKFYISASIAVSVLTACDGGGSSDGSANNSQNFPSLNTQPIYQGNMEQAKLITPETLAATLSNTLLFNSSPYTSNVTTYASQNSVAPLNQEEQGLNCFSGTGTTTTHIDTLTQTGYQIQRYQQCDLDGSGVTLNGTLQINVYESDIQLMQPITMSTSYANFKITQPDGSYTQIDGTIKDSHLASCQHIKENNISINTNTSIESILVDVKSSAYFSNSHNIFFTNYTNHSGKIYLSDTGYIDISSINLEYFQQDSNLPRSLGTPLVLAGGSLQFKSVDNTMLLTAQYHKTEPSADMPDQFEMTSHIVLRNTVDDTLTFEKTIPSWMLSNPVLINFNDQDNDKMWDGYEILFGLNPLVNDSEEDLDNDQFSNLSEFLGFSDPNNVDDTPTAHITLTWWDSTHDQIQLEGIISPYYTNSLEPFSVTVQLTTPAHLWRWQPIDGIDCTLNDLGNDSTIQCQDLSAEPLVSYLDPINSGQTVTSILGHLTWQGDNSGFNQPSHLSVQTIGNSFLDYHDTLVQ
ncbi:hypothetical protein [Vibrio methylphosphonaticus]|uniref:hypothetical protein n=1 Tax=Vibrio methylphosphonaticus TaxID=2946866 RepID=UPI00202AA9A6|nr:hypothetical protein [Vibrio methylphosphonaticus]MCL9776925.1 hypothetical protein [Vibrio methylphosphonaticus]